VGARLFTPAALYQHHRIVVVHERILGESERLAEQRLRFLELVLFGE
jgi:hypothetical protein